MGAAVQVDRFQSAKACRPASFARAGLLALALAATLGLAGCGGGGDSVDLGVQVVVGGRPAGSAFVPGQHGSVAIAAGQSIELDASEPVAWVFMIGNSPLFGNGATVIYDGLAITQTALSPSRVVIDIAVVGPRSAPVVITFSATSTIDAAQVAVVDLIIN